MTGSVAAGAALAAVAAVCYDGAVALQALEARALPEARAGVGFIAGLVRRPRWLAATALGALGWPFQLGALALAPLTIVQPTLAFGLIVLLVLGARWLGEPAGVRELVGVGTIAVGVGLLAWAAPEDSKVHASTLTLVLVLGTLSVLAAVPWLSRGRLPGWLLVVGAGCAYACSAIGSKLLVDAAQASQWGEAAGFAALTATVAGLGIADEMVALQRVSAAWTASGAFVAQTVIPVLLAPLLVGESWGATPLGGGVIVIGLVAVTAGTARLSASPGVRRLVEGSHQEDG